MLCGALPLHRAGAVFRGCPLLPLEQTCNLCVFRDINFLGCRYSGKAGHLNDLSGKNNDKARTCADVSVADRNVEAFRPPELLLIIRKRVLRLRDADRKAAEAKIRQCADGFLRCGGVFYAVRAVNVPRDRLNFFFQSKIQRIKRLIGGRLVFQRRQNLLRQIFPASAAFREDSGEREIAAPLPAVRFNKRNFPVRIGSELIDRDNNRYTELLQVLDMLAEIDNAFFQSLRIFFSQLRCI